MAQDQQSEVTIDWTFQYEEDEQRFHAGMAEVLESYPGVKIDCHYRTFSTPYYAIVKHQDRAFSVNSYGLESLVQGIKSYLSM